MHLSLKFFFYSFAFVGPLSGATPDQKFSCSSALVDAIRLASAKGELRTAEVVVLYAGGVDLTKDFVTPFRKVWPPADSNWNSELALQAGRAETVGGREFAVPAKIVALSNLELTKKFEEGKFGRALYHRLAQFRNRYCATS